MPEEGEPPLIPESVLKRRHDLDDLLRKRQAENELHPNKNKTGKKKRGFYVVKPETILAKARSRQNNAKRFQRVSMKGMQKRASNSKVFEKKVIDGNEVELQTNSVGAKLVFVIRIRNNQAIPPQVKAILHKMRLYRMHEGVFVRYNEEMRRRLHLVEPWVIYGPPSTSSVKDLVERRGFAKINDQRVPLSDNTIVENALGESHGILCVEDIVSALTNAGDLFDVAAHFLYPFQLSDSKTKFERKVLKFKDGKEYGDRGEEIEQYIQLVL